MARLDDDGLRRVEARLTPTMSDTLDLFHEALGISNKAILTLSLAQFFMVYSPVVSSGVKRKLLVDGMEKQFSEILEEVKRTKC